MTDELLDFNLPTRNKALIKVIGVGGGGSNAVSHMYKQGIKDVDFIICNTDKQALAKSPVPSKVQLGDTLTEGLGAGNTPDIGMRAAVENIEDVKRLLIDGTKMVFITAGMGGGTGTGAAPIIAEAAKELGLLTIGIVTLPFKFEGKQRIEQAIKGISNLEQHVDSLIVIDNNRLTKIYKDLKAIDAFSKADDVLTGAAKGIAEMITVEGIINVDFADVRTVMQNSGVAMMGNGMAEGSERALNAAIASLNSPLLNSNDISGAKNILLNIGWDEEEATLEELATVNEYIQDAAGNNANLIWGHYRAEGLGKKMLVTVVATGFDTDIIPEMLPTKKNETKKTPITIDTPPHDETRNDNGIGIKDTQPNDENPSNKNQREEPKVEQQPLEFDEKEREKVPETVLSSTPDKEHLLEEALKRVKENGKLSDNLEYKETQPSVSRYNLGSNNSSIFNDYSKSNIMVKDDRIIFGENTFIHRRPD